MMTGDRRKHNDNRAQTSTLLSFTVYMFTQHPEIFARAKNEVIDALGPDGTPTLEDIRKLKYRA